MRKRVALLALCTLSGLARAQVAPPYRGAAPPPYPASYPPPEPPRPFAAGTHLGGAVLGFGSGNGQTTFTFGGSYGYFVFDGFAPGLSALVTAGSSYNTTLELTPFIRFIPWRAYPISPVLIGKGGRLFISDLPDLWIVGGGGGLIYSAAPPLALMVEVIYERLLPDSECMGCSRTVVSGGVGLFF